MLLLGYMCPLYVVDVGLSLLPNKEQLVQTSPHCTVCHKLDKFHTHFQTWNLSKNLHRQIFRLKILHRQFHLILTILVRKNTKNEWKWRNLHHWQKFYTAAGSDGMDKFHLWLALSLIKTLPVICLSDTEVEFVHAVSAGGSVNFLPAV